MNQRYAPSNRRLFSESPESVSRSFAWLALVLAAIAWPACAAESRPAPATGPHLAMGFELIENQHQGKAEFLAELTLANLGGDALAGADWVLYFNFGRPMRSASEPGELAVTHINGDLWRVAPTESFAPLPPGEERRFALLGRGAVTRRSGAPAGPYVVFDDGRAQPIAYTIAPFRDIERLKRAAEDQMPVATTSHLFERNSTLELLPPEEVGRLVPTPMQVELGSGHVELDSSWTIRYQPTLEREAALLSEALEPYLGVRIPTNEGSSSSTRSILLAIAPVTVEGSIRQPGDEAYELVADPGSAVQIVGSDSAGVFYGIQTLRSLLPAEPSGGPTASLPEIVVGDAPRFPYRGLHLDVSRNFHPRSTVEKLLDLAAFYKLNYFHFHLTDDEGWRLPVAALPELTEVGARRGHTTDESDRLLPSFGSGPDPDPAASHGSGHYTRADLVAILTHAQERHIRVVPEIDVPGHARAAIKAMAARQARLLKADKAGEAAAFLLSHPEDVSVYRSVQGWDDNVIDVCMPSTYRFLETVIDEIVGLWAEAEAPLEAIHIGGDEVPAGVWQDSPACQQLLREDSELNHTDDLWAYFFGRVSAMLAERGLATAGWEEIALTTASAEEHAKEPNTALVDHDLQPYVWNNVWGWGAEDLGYRLANAGYPVVLCNATNLYFDLAYDKHPEETGYAWAGLVDTRKPWEFVPLDLFKNARTDLMGRTIEPAAFAGRARLTDEGRKRVRGIQGQLWAENSKGPEILEYQTFPKLLGLAERAWAAQPAWAGVEEATDRDRLESAAWNEFANRLGQRELPRLDRLAGGVLYRLPPPGATVIDGRLAANSAFPGLAIRYTTDGSEPTASSELYTEPVPVAGTIKLKTFDTNGRGSRTATVQPGQPGEAGS